MAARLGCCSPETAKPPRKAALRNLAARCSGLRNRSAQAATAALQLLIRAGRKSTETQRPEYKLMSAEIEGNKFLPYGDTLHYPGCGCPSSWTPGTRPADLVDLLAQRAFLGFQQKRMLPTRPLRICYMLPHHNTTGGMKCLVEHLRLLKMRGHFTIAAHRSNSAEKAMPPWSDVKPDMDLICKLHQRLGDVCNVNDIDVVVVGIFHQVAELLAGMPAPILYWEQGHEWLFGDPIRFQTQHNYQKQDQLYHMVLHLPVVLAAVSEAVQDILSSEFGRNPLLIPNGVDCERFFPGPRTILPPNLVLSAPLPQDEGFEERCGANRQVAGSVLLVGNPALPLKGFDIAIKALTTVNRVLPIHLTWICQTQPTAATVPSLVGSGLNVDLYISPRQEDLPALYRGHDVFLFTSRYEAWGMPVLEAMASGLAVVATRCLGVNSFAHHLVNCLLADPLDVGTIVRSVMTVLVDQRTKQHLQVAARETALRFNPSAIADRLEAVLYSLTAGTRELLQLRQPCLPELQIACAWASLACSKPAKQSAPSSDSVEEEEELSGHE